MQEVFNHPYAESERDERAEKYITDAVGRMHQTSEAENKELIASYLNGDGDALTLLHEGLMCLVCAIARKEYVKHAAYSILDMIPAGLSGIEKATHKYDPAKGTFASLAFFYIRKEMFVEKKSWGLTCISLDQLLNDHSCEDVGDNNQISDYFSEDNIKENITLLQLKSKRGYVSLLQQDRNELKEERKLSYEKEKKSSHSHNKRTK